MLILNELRRMRNIYRQYKFVKYLDSDIKAFENKHDFLQEMEYRLKPVSKVVKKEYAEKTGKTRLEVANIVDAAMTNDFIEVYEDQNGDKTRHLWVAPGKGRDLLDRVWIFPVGLWREWLNAYGALLSFLTGGVFGAAVLLTYKAIQHIVMMVLH